MSRLVLVALVALGLAAAAPQARAQQLVADISSHLIAISSDFTGTDLLVFGAIDGPGDIVVIVRGPRTPVVVREKDQVAGIRINAQSVTFDNVPAFYAIASSRPLDEILSDDVRRLNEIGLDQLRLTVEPGTEHDDVATFREAMIGLKQERGLYPVEPGRVNFLGDRLFRALVHFPASVAVGRYTVDVVLVRDGQVVQSFGTPLSIDKAGFGADVFGFAHRQAALYGLLAVFGAAVAGFAGSLLFRRP